MDRHIKKAKESRKNEKNKITKITKQNHKGSYCPPSV